MSSISCRDEADGPLLLLDRKVHCAMCYLASSVASGSGGAGGRRSPAIACPPSCWKTDDDD